MWSWVAFLVGYVAGQAAILLVLLALHWRITTSQHEADRRAKEEDHAEEDPAGT